MVQRRSNVESAGGMIGPGTALSGAIVNYHFASRWRHRSFVEVEDAVDLSIRRYRRVNPGRSGQVEGDDRLGK